MIIISHRISTLKNCDYVYEIKNGKINLKINMNKKIIGVVGLGYVGLPLSLAFSKKYKTFDMT